ncbi:MAG TPA: hypothetical protein PLC04_01525 [Candidatus Kapabacteria bacterium]|jgi:hypothetical protein|nr:hypothetical protein [Candidatus Kapabacteria bacterium]HOV91744.1 hypothetical protein [Candidatus Kapabacteria bacterium]
MNIPILNSYNPYKQTEQNYQINSEEKLSEGSINTKDDTKNNKTISKLNQSYINKLSNGQDELLSQNERDYFMELFPERKEMIENHIVFNRNGRIFQSNLSKGIILDGKV